MAHQPSSNESADTMKPMNQPRIRLRSNRPGELQVERDGTVLKNNTLLREGETSSYKRRPKRGKQEGARSSNCPPQNSNNNYRPRPSADEVQCARNSGGFLRRLNISRGGDDSAVWNRAEGFSARDNFYRQAVPSQVSSHNRGSMFDSPDSPDLSLKDRVLNELGSEGLVVGQGQTNDENRKAPPRKEKGGRKQKRTPAEQARPGEVPAAEDKYGADTGRWEQEVGETSSWSLLFMVVVASVRLFCDLWQRNFDFFALGNGEEDSMYAESQL